MAKKKYKFILLFLFFLFLFFLPRLLTHLQYDALEDEILAINNNTIYSASELLKAPDFTHPPLWYLGMEYPTRIFGLEYSIGYYRLLQVLILFIGLFFTTVYFWKRIPHKFIIIFLLLFLTNIEVIHLTSQHRMYSLVLSFGVFYVFYWLYIIKYRKEKNLIDFFNVGVIAALGFFSNYSMIWLIPIFPLAYLLSCRNEVIKLQIKNLFVFLTTFLISISWFIPIFIKNSLISIDANQWTSDLNIYTIFQLFMNYFGIIPMQEELGKISMFSLAFIICLVPILLSQLFVNKKKFVRSILISSFISFSIFLLVAFFTGNSLLYPRTAITLVLAFYLIITASYGTFKYSKALVFLVILLQLSQFLLYFNQTNFNEYFFIDYRYHPINYFDTYNFPQNSCLLTIPIWNNSAAEYFLHDNVTVVSADTFVDLESMKFLKTEKCELLYLLEQFSLDEKILEQQYQKFIPFDFEKSLLEEYGNQNLYLVSSY